MDPGSWIRDPVPGLSVSDTRLTNSRLYRGAVDDSVEDDIAVRERVLVDHSQRAPEDRPAQCFLVA